MRAAKTEPPPIGALRGDRRTSRLSKGERQRRALLDGLARLLEVKPIDDLTVADIASEAGVGRSGFYVYFDSKYSALAVVTTEAWTELADQTDAFGRVEGESPAQMLDRVGTIALEIWHEHAAILVASLQATQVDTQLAQLWNDWNVRLVDTLTRQLQEDLDNGVAQPCTTDLRELVTNLHAMMQHAYYLDRLHKAPPQQTRRMFETIKAIWLSSAWGPHATSS